MDAEETNLRKSIYAAQEAHAKLQDQLDREDGQLGNLSTQSESLKRQYTALEERHSALAGTLESTEAHVRHLQLPACDRVRPLC